MYYAFNSTNEKLCNTGVYTWYIHVPMLGVIAGEGGLGKATKHFCICIREKS